jgi:hypothetical protein
MIFCVLSQMDLTIPRNQRYAIAFILSAVIAMAAGIWLHR